ncbi:hypothetical protein IGI52_000987 [Enterococcus sp. DIV0187]
MYWIRVAVVTLFQDVGWSIRGGRSRAIGGIENVLLQVDLLDSRKCSIRVVN